jgi:multisubunit Na+/H+ antiporter MnhF subunit
MSRWEVIAIVLAGAMVPCLVICVFARATDALAAVEVAGTLVISALMILSEGFHRQPFVDLALVFAFLSVVGALAFARLMERDL